MAGPSGSRRFRWPVWVASGALLLLVAALLVFGDRAGRLERGARLPPVLARLDRMALVFASRISAGPRSSYFIDRFEVTNGEFVRFLGESGYRPEQPQGFLSHFEDSQEVRFDARLLDHPVVFVSQADAAAYSVWAGKRLPELDEWRRVSLEARWDSRYFLNALSTGIGGTSRVGIFESGSTRHSSIVVPAVYDILGNVAEWTSTRGPEPSTLMVAGGSFNEQSPTRPSWEEADNRNFSLGFRCVLPDAAAVVRELLAFMATAPAPLKTEVERTLLRFGNPLARLLHHLRFERMVEYFLNTGGRDDEIVLSLENGRIVVLDVNGVLNVFEAAGGQALARLGGFEEFYHAVAADLDRDGRQELYVATADPHQWASGGWAPEAPIVADRTGALHLVDPATNRLRPWSEGQAGIRDVTRAAFELDEQVDPLTGAPLVGPFGTGSHPPRTLLDSQRTPAGYVPWFHQRLYRVDLLPDPGEDPERDQLKIGWQRSMPYSTFLIPLPASGELLAPCVLWRRYGFETEYEVAARVLDLRVFEARAGKPTAAGLVVGGCQTMQPLDGAGRRFHLLSSTGHELLLSREQSRFRVARFERPGGAFLFRGSRPGPAPYSASLLYSERLPSERPQSERSDGQQPDLEQDLLIRCYNSQGRIAREAVFTAGGPYVPLLHVVPDLDGLLVLMGDRSLLCLNTDLTPRWRRRNLDRLDLDRSPPVVLDLDRDQRPELILQWGLDGFLRLDLQTGRTIDRHVNPGPSLLRLIRADGVRGQDLLLVGIRDEGLYSVVVRTGPSDRQALGLLDRLDPVPREP